MLKFRDLLVEAKIKKDGKPDDEESAELHQNQRAGGQAEFERMHTRKVTKDPEDNQARSAVYSGKGARAQNQGASLGASGEKTRPTQGTSHTGSDGSPVKQTPKGPGSSNGVAGDTSVVRTSPSSVKTDAPSARLAFSTFREEIEEIVWDDDLTEEEKQLNLNLGKGKGIHQTIYHGHFSFPHYSHDHGTRGIQHERVTSLSKEDIIAYAKKHHPNVTIHSISTGKVKRGGVWDHPGVSARSGEFEPHATQAQIARSGEHIFSDGSRVRYGFRKRT